VFPVRYKLTLYILCRRNSVIKGLNELTLVINPVGFRRRRKGPVQLLKTSMRNITSRCLIIITIIIIIIINVKIHVTVTLIICYGINSCSFHDFVV
jgi:hypothetical protein